MNIYIYIFQDLILKYIQWKIVVSCKLRNFVERKSFFFKRLKYNFRFYKIICLQLYILKLVELFRNLEIRILIGICQFKFIVQRRKLVFYMVVYRICMIFIIFILSIIVWIIFFYYFQKVCGFFIFRQVFYVRLSLKILG